MNDKIQRFNALIDGIESRCMAVDGPVTATLDEASEQELSEIWCILQDIRAALRWRKASEELPAECLSVEVFIPEEDDHITSGMWDVSHKWVLLDDYRVPVAEVTHWRYRVDDGPVDRSFQKRKHTDDDDTIEGTIRRLQKQLHEKDQEIAILRKSMTNVSGILDGDL